MITANDFREALRKELFGKAYESWNSNSDVVKVFRSLVPQKYSELTFYSDFDRQTVTVYYVDAAHTKYIVASVAVKKAKGQSHYRFGSSWCDYSYKDFDITFRSDAQSIESAIEMVLQHSEQDTVSRNEKANDLRKKIREIQALFSFKSLDEVRELCREIATKYYSLNLRKESGV